METIAYVWVQTYVHEKLRSCHQYPSHQPCKLKNEPGTTSALSAEETAAPERLSFRVPHPTPPPHFTDEVAEVTQTLES